MAPKPNTNSANAAKSSRTKYNCIARTTPRNHHIHLRLLSLFFILSPVLGSDCLTLDPHPSAYNWMPGTVRMVRVPCTCTIRQQANRRDYGTEDTFWGQNQFPSTHICVLLVCNCNKNKALNGYTELYSLRLGFAERLMEKPVRTYRFER